MVCVPYDSRDHGSMAWLCTSARHGKYTQFVYVFQNAYIIYETITYAVQDLCLHNEYRTQIRKQLDALEGSLDYKCLEDLPLLDSFMKESARLSSSDAGKDSKL